jgi:putative flippase GtrA
MTATVSEIRLRVGRAPVAFIEFLRYFLCSALALAIDSATYWLALHAGLTYPVAGVAGFLAGVSTAYLLSVRWVFRRRSVANPGVEFLVFLGIGVAGLAVTELLLWLQIGVLGFGPMAAKLCAAAGVFVFNFAGRKLVLFTRRSASGHLAVAAAPLAR